MTRHIDRESTRHELGRPLAWITGASVGLGRATARGLAADGWDLVLAGRSRSRHALTIAECVSLGARARHVELDLRDLASVASAAASAREPIAALVLNAGVAGVRGFTQDGFELAFGVNYVGHYALTRALLPQLRAHGASRIVTVASRAHFDVDHIDWRAVREPTRTRSGWHEYGRSKLAGLLASKALGRDLASGGVSTYALHPGVVATEIWRPIPLPIRGFMKLFMKSPDDAARTSLFCATAPELAGETGLYYERGRRAEPSRVVVQGDVLAAELLERTDAWLSALAVPSARAEELRVSV